MRLKRGFGVEYRLLAAAKGVRRQVHIARLCLLLMLVLL